MKTIKLAAIAAALIASTQASASDLNIQGFEITPLFNYAHPEGNLDLKDQFGPGLRLGYTYDSGVGAELGYDYYKAKYKDATDTKAATKVKIHRGHLNFLLPTRLGSSPLDAYFLAGVGYEHFSKQLYDNHDGAFFQYGAGLKAAFNEHFGLRFEVRDQIKARNLDHHFIASAGFLLAFGAGAKDIPAPQPEPVIEPVVEPAPEPAPEPEPAPKPHRCYDMEQVNVYFDFDKSAIKGEYEEQIKTLAQHINEEPAYYAYVRGYTDSIGTSAYNKKLSERRAKAAKDALIAAGVAADRVNPSWYGADNAIADNSTNEGRAKNRRVELKIVCE